MGHDDAREARGARHLGSRWDVQGPDLPSGCLKHHEEREPVELQGHAFL